MVVISIKNSGKLFEDDIRKSFPKDCLVHRLRDTAQSYNNSSKTSFTWNNECDFFVFDTKNRIFYCLELKSTKFKTMNWQVSKEDLSSKMIKYHQIEALTTFANYSNVMAFFVFNFRDDTSGNQKTYFQNIKDFHRMIKEIKRKSFDEVHLIQYGARKLTGIKKRTRYSWDIKEILDTLGSTY